MVFFILASASPRRKALLAKLSIHPDLIEAADIDETPYLREKPQDLALRLAKLKAKTISKKFPNAFVLGADTVVACGNRILQKPQTKQQALSHLHLLEGRRHQVYGGICLIPPICEKTKHPSVTKPSVTRCVKTVVQFKRLCNKERLDYINTNQWQGKAGGYAIQGHAAAFIKNLNGSYTNVVGLSLFDCAQILKGYGIL